MTSSEIEGEKERTNKEIVETQKAMTTKMYEGRERKKDERERIVKTWTEIEIDERGMERGTRTEETKMMTSIEKKEENQIVTEGEKEKKVAIAIRTKVMRGLAETGGGRKMTLTWK